jgi:hypothetical protein
MPASPSLLNVPARFKTGKLYTPIATTSAGVVLGSSGDFNVTRATTATRLNSAGLIESVASGVPRLDYYTSGGTAGCPALLVEPSAQNSALQSENFTTTWVASPASSVSVSANVSATLDPYGTNIADKLIDAAVSGTHAIFQTMTLVSGTTYTASIFLKAAERTRGRFRLSGTGAYWDLEFNLSNGVVSGVTNAFSQNFGNGWYRIGATFTANQASNNIVISLSDSTTGNSGYNYSYTGDGTSGLFVFGAQVEVGSVATSYIPTTAAAVTRNADVINLSGAVSGCIGQTEGTIYAEVDYRNLSTAGQVILQLFQDSNNRFGLAVYRSGSNNLFQFYCLVSNSVTVNIDTIRTAGIYKLAGAYANNDWVFYINGTQIGTNTSSAVPTASTIQLGSTDAGTIQFNNRIRSAALYTTRLPNDQLQALTTL